MPCIQTAEPVNNRYINTISASIFIFGRRKKDGFTSPTVYRFLKLYLIMTLKTKRHNCNSGWDAIVLTFFLIHNAPLASVCRIFFCLSTKCPNVYIDTAWPDGPPTSELVNTWGDGERFYCWYWWHLYGVLGIRRYDIMTGGARLTPKLTNLCRHRCTIPYTCMGRSRRGKRRGERFLCPSENFNQILAMKSVDFTESSMTSDVYVW